MRDIICLIGYEPAIPYFDIPEQETWFWEGAADRRLSSSRHCFQLAQILDIVRQKAANNELFMRISLQSLLDYIRYVMTKDGKVEVSLTRKCCELEDRLEIMVEFYRAFFIEEEEKRRSDITIGDLLEVVVKVGTHPWQCCAESCYGYLLKIVATREICTILFMDFIRTMLIPRDHEGFRNILNRCSEKGVWPYKFAAIKFKKCYDGDGLFSKPLYVFKLLED